MSAAKVTRNTENVEPSFIDYESYYSGETLAAGKKKKKRFLFVAKKSLFGGL